MTDPVRDRGTNAGGRSAVTTTVATSRAGGPAVPTPARLTGRTAIITGAGQGVGLGIASRFAAEGANVVIAARRAETGEPAAESIRAAGGSAICIVTDVTVRAQVEACVGETVERFGGLQIMVHNAVAGAATVHRLADVEQVTWDTLSRTAVWGSFFCAQAAAPHLRASGALGRLILITSPSGVEGSHTLPLYSPVKAAQRAMAKSLAREWGPYGVTVNCIGPVAETPALTVAFTSNPQLRERLAARTPLARIGDPEHDIGAAAAYLASDDGSYVTGQTLIVDGGHFMGF
jgi:NAD(P)-dependent dehydrogenase (short-subunit alcohol dehydrogenase family)